MMSKLMVSLVLLTTLTATIPQVFGQSDNFDDGNDDGWVRFNPLSVVGTTPTYSFPSNDVYHMHGYRIQSPAPPVNAAGPARAFSYRTNIYSDFYAAFDIAGFDASVNQAFGLLFRASNIGLGQTLGYVLNYDPQQAAGGRGQIQINFVVNEAAPSGSTVGAANVTLDPNRRYRVTLLAVGTEFTVHVYDYADLTQPIVKYHASDNRYASGVAGFFNFSRVSGATQTDPNLGKADSTFDNFYIADLAPIGVAAPGTPHAITNFPQVINRVPTTRTNFYANTNRLSFTASTLGGADINQSAIRLLVNGTDVTGSVQFSGSGSSIDALYTGVEQNKVYDVKIIVADVGGRFSTNEFTFDTFSQTYLDSTSVEVIEAEDYNYSSGQFQDNPIPSGFTATGTQVNGNGVGYLDLPGTLNIDFFDRAATPPGGATSYRINDQVYTQAGAAETAYLGALEAPINDTIRQKYSALSLPEYQVAQTRGGEWLNYTRIFTNGSYQVFLRVAGRAPQEVYLEQVTGDRTQPDQTTNRLGVFNVPNLHTTYNYRYVPLTDTNGNPVSVTMNGTNTVRLVMGGPETNVTEHVMALNYLVFVPVAAGPQLLAADLVIGPYQPVPNVFFAFGSGTITIPRPATNKFYRLRGTGGDIRFIRTLGTNLVIGF